jgi:hypothetical protein
MLILERRTKTHVLIHTKLQQIKAVFSTSCLGLRANPLIQLPSIVPAFYRFAASDCGSLNEYQERAVSSRPGNRAREKATVLTFEMKGYGL